MTNPRIPPLTPPYPAETGAWLAKWMPPGAPVEPLVLFRALATHPEFTDRMRPLGSGILGRASTIEPRERELVIARTCARCGCEYEWGVHMAFFAERVGLDADQISSLTHGSPYDPCWTAPGEVALLQAGDELHDTSQVGDACWIALCSH